MNLDIKMGGINYNVDVEIEDEYVSGVNEVSVFDGEIFCNLDLNRADLDEFYATYVDQLNEAYIDLKVALAELAGEERWERENDR